MKHLLLILLCGLGATAIAQTGTPSWGQAALPVRNALDIAHPRNAEVRFALMRHAVADAIDRVAPVEVRTVTQLSVEEQRTRSGGRFREEYHYSTVQRTDVRWQRSGEFRFARDPLRSGWWTCQVNGTVHRRVAGEPRATGMDAPVVAGKRGALVRLYPQWGAEALKVGQCYESHRAGQLGAGAPTGRLVVTHVAADGATARVLRGQWTVRPGDELRTATFGLLRGGVHARYGTALTQRLNAEGGRTTVVARSLAVDFFEHGLLDRWELGLGLEGMGAQGPEGELVTGLFARVGVGRPLPLLPEVLYLLPSLHGGLGLLSREVDLGEGNMPLFVDACLELALRLGVLELSAGLRNRLLLGDQQFAGSMPTLGLRVDLYRLRNYTADGRRSPALLTGPALLRQAAQGH